MQKLTHKWMQLQIQVPHRAEQVVGTQPLQPRAQPHTDIHRQGGMGGAGGQRAGRCQGCRAGCSQGHKWSKAKLVTSLSISHPSLQRNAMNKLVVETKEMQWTARCCTPCPPTSGLLGLTPTSSLHVIFQNTRSLKVACASGYGWTYLQRVSLLVNPNSCITTWLKDNDTNLYVVVFLCTNTVQWHDVERILFLLQSVFLYFSNLGFQNIKRIIWKICNYTLKE